VQAIREVGVDISAHTSRTAEQSIDRPWDYAITVHAAANEACPPMFPKRSTRLHWSFPDPSQATGTEDERRPCCAVPDARLPGRTGVAILAELNDSGALIPLMAISGYATVATVVRLLQAGA
jgi:CheY-like chemotaxis protein